MGQIYVRWKTKKKFITKLFKNCNLEVSFKTDDNMGMLLAHNKNTAFNKFSKFGVY